MPVRYKKLNLLYSDNFSDLVHWHHEGIGELAADPDTGMQLVCSGSKQGAEGCMAFFRPTLPDHIRIDYDITVRSHGGLIINYIAMRGLKGEDIIQDRHRLPPRTGVMADYFSATRRLQSYHISFSRFDDNGVHTDTANVRRNPGGLLVGEALDPCVEINRPYHITIFKSSGHLQFYVDERFVCSVFDRDRSDYPIPDRGKFGFRLIGSNVSADVKSFQVHAIEPQPSIWQPWS